MAILSIVHDLMSGFPAAPSGSAAFYLPGTLSPIVIYGDASGTATTNPVALDSNGAAAVWLTQLARMIVQTAGGITVSDSVINQAGDAQTANTSSAFSGATQKSVNDAALTAFGGQNFQYVPSGAWVGLTPQAWMNSLARNVLAYGSVGATTVNDGVTPADSAIAAAIADAQASGAQVVLLPAGTYLCNSGIAWSTTGITLRGAGRDSTIIKMNAANLNAITITSANGSAIEDLRITSTATSTGAGITATGTTGLNLRNARVSGFYVSNSWTTCSEVSVTGNSNFNSPSAAGASGRNFVISSTDNVRIVGITTGAFGSGAFEYEFDGTGNNVAVVGSAFSSTGVKFDATFTGAAPRFIGNYMGNVTAPFTVASAAIPQWFVNQGNGADQSTTTSAVGNTQTPILTASEVKLTAASGGAGTVTVGLPVLPAALSKDVYFDFVFVNASGGAVTWTLNAVFVTTGAIPTTDGHTISVRFRWDGAKLREVSRADTVT